MENIAGVEDMVVSGRPRICGIAGVQGGGGGMKGTDKLDDDKWFGGGDKNTVLHLKNWHIY